MISAKSAHSAFAHGEWDTCRELVAKASLAKAFAALADLLEHIELGRPGSCVDSKNDCLANTKSKKV